MTNPFQRPNPIQRPNSPQKPNQPTKSNQKKIITTAGNNNRGNGNNNNNNPPPSPWLLTETPPIDNTASFVEYLRWMREPNHQYKDGTKVQILQLACEKAQNYRNRLSILNQRTKLMAGENNTFLVKSPWRIRVGGHRGPESILLPAFDALGMPFLPSSSLRGVARNYAIREIMTQQNIDWKTAEKTIAPYFGSIDTNNKADQAGKIIFFDAYPTEGKLAMDIANNIWQWDGNNLKYSPNPNPFLSLKEATFLIGIKLASHCQDKTILDKVKQWLIKGLEEGLGSQINTGYGQIQVPLTKGDLGGLKTISKGDLSGTKQEFLRLELTIEGQLIHGHQAFTLWNWNDHRREWQMRGKAIAEVRSTAFKSMLRYWFRVFALGVLPVNQVQEWEGKLFGSINPNQYRGYLKCNILEGKLLQQEPRSNNEGKRDQYGEQFAILTLNYSSEMPITQMDNINKLLKNLTWIMLNIGGIGQGSRRPCYSRQNRERAPWWRGSTIYLESEDDFWSIGDNPKNFQQQLRKILTNFYESLGKLIGTNINYRNPHNTGQVTDRNWTEAIDINSKIIVCSGDENFNKPYALSTLHSNQLKISNNYDGNLCGKVQGGVKPSPVWIADLGDYQVVTVFGATQNPRKKYLQELKDNADQFVQIFPFQ